MFYLFDLPPSGKTDVRIKSSLRPCLIKKLIITINLIIIVALISTRINWYDQSVILEIAIE